MIRRTLNYASFKTDFPLTVDTREQPASVLYHTHDFLEIVYIKKGSGMHRHAEHDHPVRRGDCFSILPGDRHAYLPGSAMVIINVCIHPSYFDMVRFNYTTVPGLREFLFLEPIFRSETAFRHKLHFTVADQRRVEPILTAMEKELAARSLGRSIIAAGHFLRFIVLAGEYYRDSVLAERTTKSEFTGKSDAVEQAIAYIEENYDDDIRLSDVAAASLLSPSRISAKFKTMTGLSPIDYLIKTRIDEASRLLRDTKISVTDIAYRVGFHDSNYFARMFRKMTGCTPVEHREQG